MVIFIICNVILSLRSIKILEFNQYENIDTVMKIINFKGNPNSQGILN